MAGGRKREWMRKKVATMAGGGGRGQQQQQPPTWWTLRVRVLAAALRRQRLVAGGRLPRVDFLQILYENVLFYLLWVIESIVVLARVCFFFLRFGFRL
ncbi:unnamed protein product [Urochloa decumbens]|uniref:Uncharacterized protein n=1 Tax=Urochloa decumbens TaxID=240449 RepID=A0ABC8WHA4_9POAL